MAEDEIQTLLDLSDKLNSKTITLTRSLILGLLAYFADGIQYRELKNALKISDGKLIANLNELKTMGYISKSEVQMDKKNRRLRLNRERKSRTDQDNRMDENH
jgi:DNA-binding MarR family transcriptional regulator